MAQLGIPHAIRKAPAIVRSSVRQHSIKVELSTPAIGAEISNVSLADVARDKALAAEIKTLWLQHKVLFFRDQHVTPMQQQEFAAQFGELEAQIANFAQHGAAIRVPVGIPTGGK